MQKLDETDHKIIGALKQNARISYANLGRQVNLTAPAVAGRVRRLEDLGVIKGYTTQTDAAALGSGITVFIRMTVAHHREEQFCQFIRHCPEIHEAYVISGAESFLLKAAVASTPQLNEVLSQLVPYGQPTTSLVITQLPLGEAHRSALPYGLAHPSRPGVNGAVAD